MKICRVLRGDLWFSWSSQPKTDNNNKKTGLLELDKKQLETDLSVLFFSVQFKSHSKTF